MARRIESLFVSGPAGRLEALLEEPEDGPAASAALVCHPHPLHGGTMHNKVVHRIARALRKNGHAVLRFNFRGVNRSEGAHDHGVGEVEDARAACDLLRERYPALPLTLAGFSFGSVVALRLAGQASEARRVIAVGFPAHKFADAPRSCLAPRIFIHGAKDAICPPDPLAELVASLEGEKRLIWIEGADHFFTAHLDEFEAAVAGLG